MKINSENLITEKEGYEAMLYLLINYWELSGSNDLTDIISGGEYIEKDTPADSVFWDYWLEAINRVKRDGPPPIKEFLI